MKLFDTLKNIWKIEELKTRILTTLGLILVYRLGTEVVLPGIDPAGLAALKQQTSSGVLGLLDMFSGGAFSNASIFALGIMPYISASIVVQLLGIAVPYFQRMQREGESGRRKINQITRYLTIIILILQGSAYLTNLHAQIQPEFFLIKGAFFTIYSVIILAAGSMFVLWLGEKITDKGIGNGVSIIIMIGIIARLPFAFFAELTSRVSQQGGGLVAFLIEIILLFFVFCGTILLVQGTRKVPVQYAKRIVGNKQYGGVRQYIPLKINAAGVMPIIFAQAIMLLPISFVNYAASESLSGFATAFSNFTGFWYNFTFFILIVAFTYFYTAITVNPMQMSEEERWIYSRCETRTENNGIPGYHYVTDYFTGIYIPGNSCHITGFCNHCRSEPTVCSVLWRYFPVDFGRSCFGYSTTDRVAFVDASLRRIDENRTN